MKTPTSQSKPRVAQDNSFEDLYDDTFTTMQWNPGILKRAMPKENNKVRKMKSR